MANEQGASEDGPGSHEPSPKTVSAASGFDPSRIADLRRCGTSLQAWLQSMDEERRSFDYPHGVEANARDALQAVGRTAASVAKAIDLIADMLASDSDGRAERRDPATGLDPKDDSAGRNGIAQPASDPSHG